MSEPKQANGSTGMSRERRFGPASLAVMLFALALVVVSGAQAAYRVLLPTEGWAYREGQTAEDLHANIHTFTQNLLGEPSPLRPGDRLRAVEDVPVEQLRDLQPGRTVRHWRHGQTIRYTVIRDGRTLDLDVTLKRWPASTVARLNIGTLGQAVGWLAAVLMLGIGLFVVLRRPEEPAARALLLVAAIVLATNISVVVPDGPTTQLSVVWQLTAFFSYWIFGILFGPTVLILALTFPRPKRVLRRFPILVMLPYLPFWVLVSMFGLLPQIGWGLTGAFLLLSLLSILHSTFTLRDAVSRAQLLWGLGGFVAAIALFVPQVLVATSVMIGARGELPPALFAVLDSLGTLAFPAFTACLAVAILRYRLFDIDVIIRRTLVYTTLTAALGAIYFGSIVLLQTLLGPFVGENNQVAVVGSTLAIAALFQPLRRRIQAAIDRRFYRRKYDAARIVQAFSTRLRDEVDIGRLSDDLMGVVEQTLEPSSVSLWLRNQRTLPKGEQGR